MYNTNVLACYISNVDIVWFYTLIITIVLTVCIMYTIRIVLIFFISSVTGSSDLLERDCASLHVWRHLVQI